MDELISYLNKEYLRDVFVAGYIDLDEEIIFHPIYEKLFFVFNNIIYEMYVDDGVIATKLVEKIEPWFSIDEDDRFSQMSIYSQMFKTEQEIQISKVYPQVAPFAEMSIVYNEGKLERVLKLDPNNFFGFTFF